MSTTKPTTGRLGAIITLPRDIRDSDEHAKESISGILGRFMDDIIADGRDVVTRIEVRVSAEHAVQSTGCRDGKLYKVAVRTALCDYRDALVGEYALLPQDFPGKDVERLTASKQYTDDDGTRVPYTVNVTHIGDMWFEESFAIHDGCRAHIRTDGPQPPTHSTP